MRAIVEIPDGEPFKGKNVLNLECAPAIGHHVADPNGYLYRIVKIYHLIEPNTLSKDPALKLIVEKDQ